MQVIELKAGQPQPATPVDMELYSEPFPRKVTSNSTTWPVPGVGSSFDPTGDVSHCYIHDVVEHYFGAGSPVAPIGGRLYDVTVGSVGWNSPLRNNGHGAYIQNYGSLVAKVIDTCMFVPGGLATAFKVYSETSELLNKTSNVTVRNTLALGWTIFQSTRQGLEDLVIENCIFVGDVRLGYGTRSKRVTFRNNIVFGNLDIAVGDDMVIENNAIVVFPPFRPDGMTYGNGNYGISAGADSGYANLSMSGNVIYTDRPQVAWNGWSRAQALFYGVAVRDTVTRPLADFGPLVRRYPIPERDAENVFVYNPSGAETIALDGYYRVRDVRRWHSPYVSNELVMSGEPDPLLYWNAVDGTPPTIPSKFPTFGFFRLETVSQEEVIMTLEQQLQALITQLNALLPQVTALETQNTQLTQQVTTLTAERDEAVAFRTAVLPQVQANLAQAQVMAQTAGLG